MAISQYTESATTNVQLSDYQALIARDNAGSRGYAEVDLNDYADGATAPTVVVGSRWDNNGSLYNVTGSNEAISGLAGISPDRTVYIYFDVSALEFIASTTAPTFDNEKRGWYSGNDRAFFRIYKNDSGEYTNRQELTKYGVTNQGVHIITESNMTYDSLYNELLPFIPNTGDIIALNGSYERTSDVAVNIVTYAEKVVGFITIYGIDINVVTPSTGANTLSVSDGTATTIPYVSIWFRKDV